MAASVTTHSKEMKKMVVNNSKEMDGGEGEGIKEKWEKSRVCSCSCK